MVDFWIYKSTGKWELNGTLNKVASKSRMALGGLLWVTFVETGCEMHGEVCCD